LAGFVHIADAAPPSFLPRSHFSTGVISGSFMGLLQHLGKLPGVLCHEDKSEPDFGSPSSLQHFSTGWKRVLNFVAAPPGDRLGGIF